MGPLEVYQKFRSEESSLAPNGWEDSICPEAKKDCLGAKDQEIFKEICDGNYEGCNPKKARRLIIQDKIIDSYTQTMDVLNEEKKLRDYNLPIKQ
ncbi:MAG: hypothetical protein ABIJ14_01875 [Nanoarchaeota archaeon]